MERRSAEMEKRYEINLLLVFDAVGKSVEGVRISLSGKPIVIGCGDRKPY